MSNAKFTIGEWVQLARMGEHPHYDPKTKIRRMQVLDKEAIENICQNFPGELLLDFEHRSRRAEGTTGAAGWIVELQGRTSGEGAGLWCKVRWSADGERAVGGGIFRYISGTFDYIDIGGGRVRLVCLLDAGLTNRPNMRGSEPISNGETNPDETQGTKIVSQEIQVTKNQRNMSNTNALINSALGLQNEASESATLDKIKELKDELAEIKEDLKEAQADKTACEKKIAELEGELENSRTAGHKALINAAGITDEAKQAPYLKMFAVDPEAAKALLNDYSTAQKAAEKALTNRDTAHSPDALENNAAGGNGGEKKFSRDDAAGLMNSQIANGGGGGE